jgi:hypothetical protein
MKRRSTRQQERANQAQSAEDIQGGYFRTFARIALLGMQDPGANMLTRTREVENRYELLPLYLSYSNHISSEQWPLLDYAFESYFREKIAPPQNTRSRQRRGLTEEERANLALQRHSLSELLNNPELEERIRATAIKAKSRYLLLHFAALLGPEKFASAFTRFTREHRFGTIADSTLFAFLAELGAAAPQDLLNSWYFTKDLPGYEIISSESYLVRDGERTRTQIKVDLRNSTDIPGLVELNFRYRQNDLTPWWDRRQSRSDFKRTIALPAQSGKNVGILLDQPTAELIIDTYIARNLPAQIHIPFTEQKFRKRASAYDGEESYALAEAEQTGEYLVDNEDAGFELVAAEETSWLRQLLIDHFDLKKNKQPYIGMRWWDPPGTWQATSDRAFYGRFVLSGHYKKAGDGRSKVAWRTEVAESGEYEIHYYYTSPGGTRGRNRRPLDKELHFRLYHDRGSEEFTLDLERAEEGWNYLGTAHLNAGPTHLELSDLSNQGYVIADAVKWQRL